MSTQQYEPNPTASQCAARRIAAAAETRRVAAENLADLADDAAKAVEVTPDAINAMYGAVTRLAYAAAAERDARAVSEPIVLVKAIGTFFPADEFIGEVGHA